MSIVIMSMISVMFIGQAENAQNENSRLSKSRAGFFVSIKKVEETRFDAFRQWVRKVLQPGDIRAIKERKLRKLGLDDITILDLDPKQLEMLYTKGATKLHVEALDIDRYYKALNEVQYKGIQEILKTEYKIRFVEPEYYLSVKNLSDNRTVSERAANESKKKGSFLVFSVGSKLVVTLVTAMIFAALVRDLTQDVDQATAWAKFLSRLWAMISSAFMGYIVGTQLNDIDAEYIEMRVQVHTRYLQDVNFVPLSQQEEARQEYVERMKKEQVLQLDNKSNQIEFKEPPSEQLE